MWSMSRFIESRWLIDALDAVRRKACGIGWPTLFMMSMSARRRDPK